MEWAGTHTLTFGCFSLAPSAVRDKAAQVSTEAEQWSQPSIPGMQLLPQSRLVPALPGTGSCPHVSVSPPVPWGVHREPKGLNELIRAQPQLSHPAGAGWQLQGQELSWDVPELPVLHGPALAAAPTASASLSVSPQPCSMQPLLVGGSHRECHSCSV